MPLDGLAVNKDSMTIIYTEAMKYKQKVSNIAEEIMIEVKKLNNPDFLDSMRGGQGDAAVAAIIQVAHSAEDISKRAKGIAKFVDSKIEGLSVLVQDKSGFGDVGNKVKNSTSQIKK